MTRLCVISHALISEPAQARWKLLAGKYPVEVDLLVPDEFVLNGWWGFRQSWKPAELHHERLHILPLPVKYLHGNWYFSFPRLIRYLTSCKPDVIYVIGNEIPLVLHQVIFLKNFLFRKTKVIFFTMNALGVPQHKRHLRLRWLLSRVGSDAALCHYPGCLASLRRAGFKKPVFMQTQIGVDEEIFKPDANKRREIRKALGFEGAYVFGTIARFTEEKGIVDTIEVLPLSGADWKFLLVGEGNLRGTIERIIKAKGLEERIVLTGYVEPRDVATYIRAMDCLVHVPYGISTWIETFSLAVAQAMAMAVPVIGSRCGCIPWQVQDGGLIIPERDKSALRQAMIRLASTPGLAEELGNKAFQRATSEFCTRSLTDHFFSILKQVESGRYLNGKHGQSQSFPHLWEGLNDSTRL